MGNPGRSPHAVRVAIHATRVAVVAHLFVQIARGLVDASAGADLRQQSFVSRAVESDLIEHGPFAVGVLEHGVGGLGSGELLARFQGVDEDDLLDALEEARTEMESMWAGVARRKESLT